MAIQNCALVQNSDETVINIIVADPIIDPPHDGTFLVGLPDNSLVQIGWIYNPESKEFTDPNPPPPAVELPPASQPTLVDLQTQLAALTAQIQALAGQNV